MARPLRISPSFRDDLRDQIAWLEEHHPAEHIERLREGLDEAIELLTRHPALGSVEERRDPVVMRKLLLRRLPFAIWYSTDESAADTETWLLRLFHVRQDRLRSTQARKKKRR